MFQALRIAVNNELGELESICQDMPKVLTKDGTILILTFHSLERGIIENNFKNFEKIEPKEDEIRKNSRAKSAVGYVIHTNHN